MALRRTSPLILPAISQHTATIIFAHGLGDSGHGWASAVEQWRRHGRLDEVKFVLPHAPTMPITIQGGARMPAWFDVLARADPSTLHREAEDAKGIKTSVEFLEGLIQAEVDDGIPVDRIVLGGFSQGGAMAMFTGLTTTKFSNKLAGIVALSSWLLMSAQIDSLVPAAVEGAAGRAAAPFLMGHGDRDQVIPVNHARLSREAVHGLGFDVTLKEYPGMAHSVCLEEMEAVEAFLVERLPPAKPGQVPALRDEL